MLRTRGMLVLLAVSLLLAGVALGAESAKGMLDGKTFSGTLGEKGKTEGDKDDYIFKDGTFRSTTCDAYGFSAAAYNAKADGDSISFESTTNSTKEGEMAWKGKVKGDTIAGTVLWKKAGQAPKDYWFKGALKK
jgi:hypothetical protein